MQGYCLVAAVDKRKQKYYRLMDEKNNPVQYVQAKTVDRMDRFITKEINVKQETTDGEKVLVKERINIWKRDGYGRKSFNLSMIRRLHGRSILKKIYKIRNDDHAIVAFMKGIKKTIKKSNTKTKQDEDKILTLF